jgi:hypothetical protein
LLITNAPLFVVTALWGNVSLETGQLDHDPDVKAVGWVRIKHPFPTPAGESKDFRDSWEHFALAYKETIYVIQAKRLSEFLTRERRERWLGQPQP